MMACTANYESAAAVITNWPKVYLAAIERGEEVVSHEIRAVYERECLWMDKPPEDPDWHFIFDAGRGLRPITFIERFCKQSKGKLGAPLHLQLFQKAKLQLAFGWLDSETGLRRFREVIDMRGRKCGKSTETAAVALYCLVADGEGGPEVYCCANKLDQSKLIFREACNMVRQSPALNARLTKRRSDIYDDKTLGVMAPLAADSSTLDGLNTSFFCLDEWHEAKTSEVFDVMFQSQYARRQPLAWLITTNGFVRGGFFDDHIKLAAGIALWTDGYHDFSVLPLLYKLDDRAEFADPHAWAKANPGLGAIKDAKKLAENVKRAERDPSFKETVMAKDFNQPSTGNSSWLSYDAVRNSTTVPLSYLEHSYAIGGCDLSSTTDLTCATLLIRRPGDEMYYVLQQYFMPEARLLETEAVTAGSREAPYRRWAEAGWLTICEGSRVNFHDVTLWFVEMVQKHDIRPLWVCYDAALSGYWVPEMQEYGFDMERIRQGPFTWSYPMKDLGAALTDHKIVYNDNPLLFWCLTNTDKKSLNANGIETIQPVKKSSNRRIDGMVSLLNAWVGYCNHTDEYMTFLR